MNDQEFFNIIAILAKRLGGNVVITKAELVDPPAGTVTRNSVDDTLIIDIE